MGIAEIIKEKKTAIGLELGSTRIKAVLLGEDYSVLALGTFDWENQLVDGVWTYDLELAKKGVASCFKSLKDDVKEKYGVALTGCGCLGISGMMHGYIALNKNDEAISIFHTWRNTNTQEAADKLTEEFNFNIPLRWSGAHLYQRILEKEPHVKDVEYVTTLAGYIHYLLTGEKVLGVGDASGMFPIDPDTRDFDEGMVKKYDELLLAEGMSYKLRDVFPKVLCAGEAAGTLTEAGAKLLDPSGEFEPGTQMAPPEGDAGTGMVATNSVTVHTGNISAGTSIFAMFVLDGQLKNYYRDIDVVTTPAGDTVAMSHANNGTTDLNAWVNIFKEFCEISGLDLSEGKLFEMLYKHSLTGDPDGGDLLSYGFYSGENVFTLNEGRPMLVRLPESRFTLANLFRTHLYTSLGAVRMGIDTLKENEDMKISRMTGHGGLFKTEGVADRFLAAALNAPVTTLSTASEGGPYGMALLARFCMDKESGENLGEFLENKVFGKASGVTVAPVPAEVEGFNKFMERFRAGLSVEQEAVRVIR